MAVRFLRVEFNIARYHKGQDVTINFNHKPVWIRVINFGSNISFYLRILQMSGHKIEGINVSYLVEIQTTFNKGWNVQ